MTRDNQLENDIMLAATVDRFIAGKLHSRNEITRILPVYPQKRQLVFTDGRLLLDPHSPIEQGECDLYPFMTWDKLFMGNPALCEPRLSEYSRYCDPVVNGLYPFNSRFPFLRLAQYPNFGADDSLAYKDLDFAHYLKNKLNVSAGWSQPWTASQECWGPSSAVLPESYVHSVYDINGVLKMQFIVLEERMKYAVLPVTLFSNKEYMTNFVTFVLPPNPHAWLNEDLITEYPDATIYLTTDVLKALNSEPSEEELFLANLGSVDWLERLDFSVFCGRKLVVECVESWDGECYTIKLLEKLRAEGIDAEVVLISTNRLIAKEGLK